MFRLIFFCGHESSSVEKGADFLRGVKSTNSIFYVLQSAKCDAPLSCSAEIPRDYFSLLPQNKRVHFCHWKTGNSVWNIPHLRVQLKLLDCIRFIFLVAWVLDQFFGFRYTFALCTICLCKLQEKKPVKTCWQGSGLW